MALQGRFHQGALRVSRFNSFEGNVRSDALGSDIVISGRADMNRAMDGEKRPTAGPGPVCSKVVFHSTAEAPLFYAADIVVVEVFPQAQWKRSSSRLPSRKAAAAQAAGGGEGESSVDTAAILADEEGEVDEEAEIMQVAPGEHFDDDAPGPLSATRPCGKVVGIIKRNWRTRGCACDTSLLHPFQRKRSARADCRLGAAGTVARCSRRLVAHGRPAQRVSCLCRWSAGSLRFGSRPGRPPSWARSAFLWPSTSGM